MIPSTPAQSAASLPPLGPLLGSAYDKAVILASQSWRVIGLMARR